MTFTGTINGTRFVADQDFGGNNEQLTLTYNAATDTVSGTYEDWDIEQVTVTGVRAA